MTSTKQDKNPQTNPVGWITYDCFQHKSSNIFNIQLQLPVKVNLKKIMLILFSYNQIVSKSLGNEYTIT